MGKRRWTDEQLTKAVTHNTTITGVIRELGLKVSGGAHEHIKGHITSHFLGQASNKGRKFAEGQIKQRPIDISFRVDDGTRHTC